MPTKNTGTRWDLSPPVVLQFLVPLQSIKSDNAHLLAVEERIATRSDRMKESILNARVN